MLDVFVHGVVIHTICDNLPMILPSVHALFTSSSYITVNAARRRTVQWTITIITAMKHKCSSSRGGTTNENGNGACIVSVGF